MSVRRLAEDQVQPTGFAFNAENAAWAQATIRKYPEGRQQSAVIPLLMRAQEQDGWVTRAAIESVANQLGMPYIRVLEVATFYTQFQLKPVGTRAHVQVCGTTPCMLRGSEALMKVCQKKIHHDPLHLNDSGTLSWEEVECQGACVNAPMVIIFKDSYEDLTPERLEEIIDAFEAGKGADVPVGPQIDRIYSAPMDGLTSLTTEDKIWPNQVTAPQPAAVAEPAAEAAPVPPSNAAKPVTAADEANPALKTPVTAKAASEANAKVKGENRNTGVVDDSADKQAAASARPSLDHADRPKVIDKPAAPDDLEVISGIGPKIRATLHELGIYTYAQIAAWTDKERAWINGYMSFRGRVEREEWIKQADALAKGGEAEYIRVFGKKPR